MRRVPALAASLAVLWLLPAPAWAQAGGTVTLSASAARVTFGEGVTLSGTVAGSAAGTTVQIVDAADTPVATATTDGAGAFEATIAPERTETYRAVVGSSSSAPVAVEVRAAVGVRMGPVRLFDRVTVRGTVAPPRPGERVEVALTRAGRVVDTRTVTIGASGAFDASFRVGSPGTYRARAAFSTADLSRGVASSEADRTPLPRLASGDTGVFVRLLEVRLGELDYRLTGRGDGRYDLRTVDAVVAFHKVQRMERRFVVTRATWRRLADPIVPRAERDWNGFHIEVDQTRQVLYTVQGGEITNILHVSTGAGGATRDGTYRVFRKLAGYSPNRLYYPSYFDGLRALHGWTEVPTYAASHGCVRIPYWNATWVYALADYGTRVVIYH